MDALTRDIRKFIYDRLRETARAPVLEQIMARFGLARAQARAALETLHATRHLVLLERTERILMAHPFAAIASPFRVAVNGSTTYFANCSWDSIAMHVMLGEPVRIESFCHQSGEQIVVELANDSIKSVRPERTIVYLGLPAAQWWQDIVYACSNTMVYFASRERLAEWLAAGRVEKPGEALSIEKTIQLSVPIYRRKMALEYERPSPDELRNHFRNLDLEGDFWAI